MSKSQLYRKEINIKTMQLRQSYEVTKEPYTTRENKTEQSGYFSHWIQKGAS